jgi:ribosomal protein L7/L12
MWSEKVSEKISEKIYDVDIDMVNYNTHKRVIESYKEAINIIEEISTNPNWSEVTKLITYMAKNSPETLVESYKAITDSTCILDRKLIDLYKQNKRITAIKLCRKETNTGLKEAKDYCDELWRKMG